MGSMDNHISFISVEKSEKSLVTFKHDSPLKNNEGKKIYAANTERGLVKEQVVEKLEELIEKADKVHIHFSGFYMEFIRRGKDDWKAHQRNQVHSEWEGVDDADVVSQVDNMLYTEEIDTPGPKRAW